ncbi:MAG: hypothetical protein PHR16_06635 [Methylovulum sp.]|nr:hypothetical protein [Methylovulum sp.]
MSKQTNTINTKPTFITRISPVLTDFGADDQASRVVVQTDGKIVVAGTRFFDPMIGPGNYDADFAVARYNGNGDLDTSFSGNGQLTTKMSNNSFASSIAMQDDGKILVVGSSGFFSDFVDSYYEFTLARYNSNGSLDTGFSGDGIVTAVFSGNINNAYSVALQRDGKILVAGQTGSQHAYDGFGSYDFGLVRYNGNGSLDTSFSGDGKVTTDLGFDNDAAHSVLVQPNGKIVAAGTTGLVRYNSDGSLDGSFSGDGKLPTDFSISNAMLQADGKLIVAGDKNLARYNSDGSLDNSFSGDGKVMADFPIASSLLQADGKLVVAGDKNLARYNSDGSLDNSFSGDGKVRVDFPIASVTLQPDGKIVIAGEGPINADDFTHDFAVARYNSDGSLDNSFGTLSNSLSNTINTKENAAPVIINDNVQVGDAELDALNAGNGNYYGASLTLMRHSGAKADDVFAAGSGGTLSLTDNSITLNGKVVGSSEQMLGKLTLHFTTATTQQVNSTLQQLAYRNSSEQPPATIQLDWAFNDGDRINPLSTTGFTVIKIAPSNDAPHGYVSINGIIAQGQTLTASNNLTDADGLGTINYQWQSSPDGHAWSNLSTGTDIVLTRTLLAQQIKLIAFYTDGQGFNNSVYSIQGTKNNDELFGGAGNQRLSGGDGNDSLLGGRGNDVMDGGNGKDWAQYWTASAGVTVNLGLTTAQNTLGAGTDTLIAIENINGSHLNDTLIGDALDNALYGEAGDDKLNGGGGNDSLLGGRGDDAMDGGNGRDWAQYWTANAGVTVNLRLTVAQNTVGAGKDTLRNFENISGSGFNDTLIGNALNNILLGGAGNDTLNGSLGNDRLKGGAGQDTFVFNTPLGVSNIDTIIDFSVADDTIKLDNSIFIALTSTGVLAANAFKVIGNGNSIDDDDHILYNTASGGLFYDADGSGVSTSVQIGIIGKGLAVTQADFMVV